ncbi:MAG: transcription-repair coupling factor [Lachnospiraceae bacterium]|nr:transcription-repair coupling factor [Lachnospiraceae bacterium]
MEAILTPVRESSSYQAILQAMERKGFVAVSGLSDTAFSCAVHCLGAQAPYRLIVTYGEQRARQLEENYRFFDRKVWVYPAKDVLFYSADVHGNAIARQRIEILKQIIESEEATIILPVEALMERLPELSQMKKNRYRIQNGDTIDIKEFNGTLTALGYQKKDWVEGPGQYAVRGGILDVYPLTEDCPYRIELWGDEVDSLRSFDVESQRSIEELQELVIYPAREIVLTEDRIARGLKRIEAEHKTCAKALKESFQTEAYARLNRTIKTLREELLELQDAVGADGYLTYFYENLVSILDYFPEDTKVFVDEPKRVAESAGGYQLEFQENMKSRLEGGYILPGQAELLLDMPSVIQKLEQRSALLCSVLLQDMKDWGNCQEISWETKLVQSYNNHFDLLVKNVTGWKKKGYRIVILCSSSTRAKRIAAEFEDYDIVSFYSEDLNRTLRPSEVMVAAGRLAKGFEFPEEKLVVVSESDIFQLNERRHKRRLKPKHTGEKISSFADISVGDYVVHENHGIGIYRGIEKIEVDKVAKDYITIEYKDNSKLYILASQLDMIQKFSSKEGARPKIDKLGGAAWQNTKNRVKGHVAGVAKELVQLYAIRQEKEGYAYSSDTIWQKEFEEAFPYEETEDQLRAIEETKQDMESNRIMDRLICGDVGYGKTEIAIRAAFKAVQDGKQVVYLVPTTILAQQHYATFMERMKNYPVNIKMMSRFCTAREQKKILEGLKNGMVDIVIGTHRLFSKDIVYKNLGLLIIDEEQRFGVAHKEKIKQMKKDIDVLTLTATPIPRTLHMSLIGIRSMSLLEEPPVDRQAIQTYVLEYNPELVREAINRELARGGQVYYVYNRVNDIDLVTAGLQELLPEARIAYAHGQMKERELETIMYQFINGDIDVLVSTTIIETGLDISNVNTMIIQDAENFGLSQLYQLRGRVGRSNRRASAFLMYRRDKMLKETAEKRLQAIREFTDLGSGYRIALRDLEIRGAGNLLGEDQSGHMEAVGYELYCKMLNDAIREQKGEEVEETFETTIELPVDAYIPATYVKNEFTKLELYKRIATISSQEALEDMQDELIDRFGDMPVPVENLLEIALLKAKAHEAYIAEITEKGSELHFVMYPNAKVDTDRIDEFMKNYNGKMRFDLTKTPTFVLKTTAMNKKERLNCVESVINQIPLLNGK